MAHVVLRYFEARGRAQPLRHALADAGVDYDDVRVPLASWPERRGEPGFGGPFAGLPTLTWYGVTLGETLPVATFLAHRLGHYDQVDELGAARLDGIVSSCYLDALMRIADVIWADVAYPGADLAASVIRLLGRTMTKLERLDAATPAAGWLGRGTTPAMPDFFAAEAIEAVRHVLGPAREAALAARLPRLCALADRLRARPAVAEQWRRRPPQFSGRPDEPATIARLRALDLSPLEL